MIDLLPLRREVNRRLGKFQAAKDACRTESTALEAHERDLVFIREGLAAAQTVAASVQAIAHQRIADIVTRSLAAVFEQPYTFKVVFAEKRGRTEASLIFMRDGEEMDPMNASGGGVVSIASFALRLSCMLLSEPPVRRFLICDEPFAHLSVEYRPRLRQLLDTLAQELGVQILLITHLQELAVGKVIQL